MNKIINKQNFVDEVFEPYHKELYNFVMSRTGYKVHLAEDITQDIFLKLWKSRKSYDKNKASIRTWMYQIARNYLIDIFRKKKLEFVDDAKGSTELKTEDKIFVENMLQKLNDRDRELVQLRYIQDLSIKEIAQIIDKNESATKVAIHRAIKKLRKIYRNG